METEQLATLQAAWDSRRKLYAEGDKLWCGVIIQTYGPKMVMDWTSGGGFRLPDGTVFAP